MLGGLDYHSIGTRVKAWLSALANIPLAKGDLWSSDGTINQRVAVSATNRQALQADSTKTAGLGYAWMRNPIAYLRESQASGVAGGTATSGSWITRTLNEKNLDADALCVLAVNQFTLVAGTYNIRARAPFIAVNKAKIKLRNVTQSTDTIIGSTAYGDPAGVGQAEAVLETQFTSNGTDAYAIQYQVTTTSNTTGLGAAASFGVVEVFTEVWLERVA